MSPQWLENDHFREPTPVLMPGDCRLGGTFRPANAYYAEEVWIPGCGRGDLFGLESAARAKPQLANGSGDTSPLS